MFTTECEKQQMQYLGTFGFLGGAKVEPTLHIDYRKISELDPDILRLVIDFFNN